MEPTSPTSLKLIQFASALVEDSPPSNPAGYFTKVIQVAWTHVYQTSLGDGEWGVFWDIDATLEGGEEEEGEPEEGLDENVLSAAPDTIDERYFDKLFQQRPVVQTPTRILPQDSPTTPLTPSAGSQRLSAFFLLSKNISVPEYVTIRFTPTWASPVVRPPSAVVPVTPVPKPAKQGDLHRSWALSRFVDLVRLKVLAKELQNSGQRGMGVGRFKVGVDGGGHDEEQVQREAEMVDRELKWVAKTFQNQTTNPAEAHQILYEMEQEDELETLEDEKEIERQAELLKMLEETVKVGLDDELPDTTTIHISAEPTQLPVEQFESSKQATADESDEEGGLFALPLSPRSPEMETSPFSFRGPAVGSLDATLLGSIASPPARATQSSLLNKDAISVGGGVPLTPTLGSPSPSDLRKKRPVGATGGLGSS
ncbi:hypothetical protein DFH27DRAFT_244802 [Peziza echinospora]|nr:hypothetical protein DFH27DRAFT_244802 [Peziza echinospora]